MARIDSSELHCTTSILTGPSPKICMISVPSNFRLAHSSAHAAIISPSTVCTGAGYVRRVSTSCHVLRSETISPRTGAALNMNFCNWSLTIFPSLNYTALRCLRAVPLSCLFLAGEACGMPRTRMMRRGQAARIGTSRSARGSP
ncbi:protein of unknown function [Paraburkholderia kururiensis]